ncbi:MAG: hypothetical protein ABIQ99_15270 [Thermoflexales bacterium]
MMKPIRSLVTVAALLLGGCISTPTAAPAPISTPTAIPVATSVATATGVPTVAATRVATATPAPPTVTPASSATPAMAVTPVDARLGCALDGATYYCRDQALGLSFRYPAAWGRIGRTNLRTSTQSGRAYDLVFDRPPVPPLPAAGGRSRDFAEGRGGLLTDFGGYDKRAPGSLIGLGKDGKCDPTFASCERIQPNVVLALLYVPGPIRCEGGPILVGDPVALVAIDLPNNPNVNGFVFAASFLSEATLARLNATIGVTTQGDSTRCGSADVAAYDATLKDLLMGIQTGRADVETMANVSALRALAQSIAPLP